MGDSRGNGCDEGLRRSTRRLNVGGFHFKRGKILMVFYYVGRGVSVLLENFGGERESKMVA